MLNAAEQDHWLGIARRYTRPGIEPADVLQEACLAAMKARRTDLSTPQNQRYFRGIIRKTAWAMRRAEVRRQRHERSQSDPVSVTSGIESAPAPDLSSLPTSLQAVANLVMANLDRDELRSALSISDDALRRRLADLRRHLEADPFAREQIRAAVESRAQLAPEEVGLIRQALVIWLKTRSGSALGTVDPDGHLIAVAGKSATPLTNPHPPATDK